MIRLEPVIRSLPDGFAALRAEARGEGFRMLDVLNADWLAGTVRFDRDGERLLAGYWDEELAGIGGLTIDPYVAGAFRMRRFYVRAAHRRCGMGAALAATLLALPGPADRLVTVNVGRGSADFWQALGFVADAAARHTHIYRR